MAAAEENDARARVNAPARVAIVPAREPPQDDAGRLVVTVTGFKPAITGTVEGVVLIPCGTEEREIGRFGIFPQQSFTAGSETKPQHFGFALPAGCKPSQVAVRVEPSAGDGIGAELVIGEVAVR
ncbi:hypothetical protein [Nitrobacter winogradskyi]|uniref:hypothetical protein n=1 Tax=Nitrobacter winogradskyi TaxID=913 RepID=UPI0011D17AAB|nr:hypothetical protein [Nitrobacter winogradskyi]